MGCTSIIAGTTPRERNRGSLRDLFGRCERYREWKRAVAVLQIAFGDAVETEELRGRAVLRQRLHSLECTIHGACATIELFDRAGGGLELARHLADRFIVFFEFAAHGTEDIPHLAGTLRDRHRAVIDLKRMQDRRERRRPCQHDVALALDEI